MAAMPIALANKAHAYKRKGKCPSFSLSNKMTRAIPVANKTESVGAPLKLKPASATTKAEALFLG